MVALISFLLNMLASLFKSKSRLEAENAALRHQLIVLQRKVRGRPQIDADLRALIRRMSVDNLLWGAPHIHGELLKLGFAVAQSTVTKYMVKRIPLRVWAASCATTRRRQNRRRKASALGAFAAA